MGMGKNESTKVVLLGTGTPGSGGSRSGCRCLARIESENSVFYPLAL